MNKESTINNASNIDNTESVLHSTQAFKQEANQEMNRALTEATAQVDSERVLPEFEKVNMPTNSTINSQYIAPADAVTLQATQQLQRQPLVPEALNANATTNYIYAAGNLRIHFPNAGLEKECQAAARILNIGPRDYYDLFTYKDSNGHQLYRYIAEQVSWILNIDNQDVYVLLPSSHDELTEFINTLKQSENETLTDDILSVVIGHLGPMAPAELSGDLPLRMVMCKHIYNFTSKSMLQELNKNINTTSTFIRNVLDALLSNPNMGVTDIDRAKNFIAYRYSSIFIDTSQPESSQSSTADTSEQDQEHLESMEAKPSQISPSRSVIDIIFTYKKNISGRTSTYAVSVDVSDQFPFIHADLSNYIPTN